MTNSIIVQETGDQEDLVEGGYTSIYAILQCEVDDEKGILEYGTRAFPAVPSHVGTAPSKEYTESIPQPGRVFRKHVREMTQLNDEEIQELRSAGVRIEITPRKY